MSHEIKRILVVLTTLVVLLSPVSAWDDETNLANNESITYGANAIFNSSSLENPYRYYAYDEEFAFINPAFRSNDRFELCTTYFIYKYYWNGTHYINDSTCYITIEECIQMEFKVDYLGAGYWHCPDNVGSQMTDGYLTKRYFQEMLNAGHLECAEYNNSEEIDDPDIFYIEAHCDVGNDELNTVLSGALILDANAELAINNKGHDFGFNLDGLAGEGGDDIFNEVGLGKGLTSGSKESQKTFNILFYGIIPMFFIFAMFKMMQKVGR